MRTFGLIYILFNFIINVCLGYSGTRGERSEDPQHAEDYTARDAGDNPESDIAGLTDEEQLEMAIRNSLNDGGKRDKLQLMKGGWCVLFC